MKYIPLDEDSEPLTLAEVAGRWITLFPNEIDYKEDDNRYHLTVLNRILPQYINGAGRKKLVTCKIRVDDNSTFRELVNAFGGSNGYGASGTKIINAVECSELNRFERENFLSGGDDVFDSFDPDSDTYPLELDIALQVWRAVAINGQGGAGTGRQRLVKLLNDQYRNSYKLNDTQIDRIATVCNFDKAPGARKIIGN